MYPWAHVIEAYHQRHPQTSIHYRLLYPDPLSVLAQTIRKYPNIMLCRWSLCIPRDITVDFRADIETKLREGQRYGNQDLDRHKAVSIVSCVVIIDNISANIPVYPYSP